MSDSYAYKNRKFNVVSYNPAWAEEFSQCAVKIRRIFGNVIIEHIGSTSVPGMVGKPCIDVLVLISDVCEVENYIEDMKQAGFEYAGEFVMEDSRLFRVIDGNTLIANIHFFPADHPHVIEMINLGEYLRTHLEEIEAYSNLKLDLFKKYPDDYASYRKYKDEYMKELQERVKRDT